MNVRRWKQLLGMGYRQAGPYEPRSSIESPYRAKYPQRIPMYHPPENVQGFPWTGRSLVLKVAGASKSRPPTDRYGLPIPPHRTITAADALRYYHLTGKDLEMLPHEQMRSPYHGEPPTTRFFEVDVYHRACQVHGGRDEVEKLQKIWKQIGNAPTGKPASFIQKERRKEKEKGKGLSSQSGKVVKFAIAMNCFDAMGKFVGFWLTGSRSLLAESLHSMADTVNQIVLAVGIASSTWTPTRTHPYGYGNLRYVTSLISGVGIFFVGCGASIYSGLHGIMHPEPLPDLAFAFYALGLSAIFQSMSAARAYSEIRQRARKRGISTWKYVQSARDPSINVVLLEDGAAVCGVAIALGSITVSALTANPFADSVGSVLIGALLGSVAVFVIKSNTAHLVGQSAPNKELMSVMRILENDAVVGSVQDVKAIVTGPDQVRFKAEVDFNGRQLTKMYLREADMSGMLRDIRGIRSEEQLRTFMIEHGHHIIDRLGKEVDRLEAEMKAQQPNIRHIDLEAL